MKYNVPNFDFSGGFKWSNVAFMFKKWALLALGIGIASHIVEDINYSSGQALVYAVLLMSIFNIVLKPLLILFTLPFIILTMGIGVWFINALMFILVSKVVSGFDVASFKAALWGALVVSIVSLIIDTFLDSKPPSNQNRDTQKPNSKISNDDVIDI